MKKTNISPALAALLCAVAVVASPVAMADVQVFDSTAITRLSLGGLDGWTDDGLTRFGSGAQGWAGAAVNAAAGYGFAAPNQATATSGFLATAPVPEPASYGMLAAGLGMLAFTARRQSSQKLG